jgi:hypothetical protein
LSVGYCLSQNRNASLSEKIVFKLVMLATTR